MAEARPPLWVEREGGIALRAVHCSGCGADLFPPQAYGCTVCGARARPTRSASGRCVWSIACDGADA
jgi:hypothetical protein